MSAVAPAVRQRLFSLVSREVPLAYASQPERRAAVVAVELREMRKDTYAGMGIANIVFLAIVITAA
ncbi:MAG: hypothetical protein RR747_10820, partial [Gordonibacter sp.]